MCKNCNTQWCCLSIKDSNNKNYEIITTIFALSSIYTESALPFENNNSEGETCITNWLKIALRYAKQSLK